MGIITEEEGRGWHLGLLWTAGLWEEGPFLCGIGGEKGDEVWRWWVNLVIGRRESSFLTALHSSDVRGKLPVEILEKAVGQVQF